MDEKQLQFLFNEYAKGKGFKDFSEFKGLMDSEPSRKMFFEESNKELGFKDYNEFNDLLGLKKKASGVASVPTESKSQLPSYLEEGKKMAQVGFATPQIVSEDVKDRGKKVRVSPKFLGFPGTVDVEVVEKSDDDGSYKNLAQNLANNFIITGGEIGAGLAQMLREEAFGGAPRNAKKAKPLYTPEGEKTEYAKTVTWAQDPLAKVALGLNGIIEPAKELQQTESGALPDTFAGNTLKGLSAIVPDLAATALMPEAKIAQGASFLTKAGSLLFNNFTKYLMVKEPLMGYNEAKKKAIDPAAIDILSDIGKGAVSGIELALLGAGSGLATKGIMSQAAKIGLVGKKGFAAKELANLATDVTAYGLISPAIHTLSEEGRLPTVDEISEGAGIAIAFRGKDLLKNAKTFGELNRAVDQIQQEKQGAALYNFLQATPESIVRVYNGKESAAELNLKALEAAKKAREAVDPAEKEKAVMQASVMAKAANVKQMAEMFVDNKGVIDAIQQSDLPTEAKMAIIEKADIIKKSVDPVEIQKTQAGQRMQQGQKLIQDLTLEMNGEQDPVRKAELKFRIEQTEKGLKMQENGLMSLIEAQSKEGPLDLTDVNTIKQSRKAFNEQIDLKLEALDKNDPDYFEKVENFNKQREERNDYFDRVLEAKKQDESGVNVMTPEEMNQIDATEISFEPRGTEGQMAETPIEDIVTVESFADRIASGEKMQSPEDLQFYENNKAEIESALKAKAEVKPTELDKSEAERELEKGKLNLENNEKRNPNAKHPLFNVGQKWNEGSNADVREFKDERKDKTKDGVEVITKIHKPATVDSNGKMTSLAEVEVSIFDSIEQAKEFIDNQYNKYKTLAEERISKAEKQIASETKPKSEVKPAEVEAPLKENEYYHATDATEILAPSDKGYKKREGANVVGEGIYFGKDKEHLTDRFGKNAIKAELDIKNPLITDNVYVIVDGREIDMRSLSKEDIDFLKGKGYDAIKYVSADRAYSNWDETVVFDKSQIKVKEEVKPTEVKEAPKQQLDQDNRSYTTKSGRQKVEYEKGVLVVRDAKTGKEVSDVTRKKAIDEYIDNFNFEKGERSYEIVTELPSGLNEEEGKRFIVENSKNPLEVVEMYAAEPKESKLTTEEQLIADYGLGKLTQQGFERFGDENLITGGMARTYFNKQEGTPIDVRAKEMSDYYGKEITPQDIIDFMIAYPSGASQAVRMGETRVAKEAAARFQELTGIDLNSKVAERIIDAEMAKAEAFEQELIKQEYETREQLEEEYYRASAEADRLAEEGNRPAAKESEKTTAVEPKKEVTLQDIYDNLPKSEKLRNKQIESIVNRDFDSIIKQLEKYKEC